MATTTVSTACTAQFNRILSDFKRELSQDEIQTFNFTSSMDLKESIRQLQKDQMSVKHMKNLYRLNAFVEAMDQFDKVVHVFLNASNYLGFIWGPAKFMLLTASSYAEALNTLLDAYQEIGEHIPLLQQYESQLKNNPYIQELVGLIFKDVLIFHRKAMKHFRQRAWRKLFHATWRTFGTDFSAIISNLQSHRRLLDSQAIFLSVQETMKVMKEVHDGRRVLDAECRRRKDEEERYRQHAVISWLSAADSTSDHEEALAIHEEQPESGRWFFQQDVVKNWVNSCLSSDSILWVNGKPGAGKTILASSLIAERRNQSSTPLVYFYCKHGDTSRDNFIGFAKSAIFQFTRLNPSLLPFILEKRAVTGTASLRSPRIAKEILEAAIESSGDLIFIVDGLDECIMAQKKEIIAWVRSAVALAETDGSKSFRACFFSQEDNDIGKLLRDVPTFRIMETHNSEDILRFCRRRAITMGKSFQLSPQDVENMASHVADKADGMFLYAKLVMVHLEGQVSKAALSREMKEIPPNLNQMYTRIKHRILDESSPSERQVAITLLSWLLCAKRPLTWHEIQGAMSLNLDDGSFDCDRRLFRNIKDFCGSLIEVRKGGAICFVHLTAKYFLQKEPALPTQLEDINLTRLCFSQLCLPSYSENSRDSVRQHILRGEYAFTEYALVYAFDHLLHVLESKDLAFANHGVLSATLRKFVSVCVTAPSEPLRGNKNIDKKLQLFEEDDFYQDLKHAIVYHTASLKGSSKAEEDEGILPLLQHFHYVRSKLELMVTSKPTEQLETLYGQDIFKCSEPLCGSFHTGFPTQKIRDKHCELHERMHLCSIPGCASNMIGFSSLRALQKHEQDYHKELDTEMSFPWHGTLKTMDILAEIKKGNHAALELWLSQYGAHIPSLKIRGFSKLLEVAARHGQNKMLRTLLNRSGSKLPRSNIIKESIRSGNDEGVQIVVKGTNIDETAIYRNLKLALRLGKDAIAKILLNGPSSAVHGLKRKRARKAAYLNLAIRFGRKAIFMHLMETYKVDPNYHGLRSGNSLFVAAEFSRIEMAKFLIKNKGCDKWAIQQHLGLASDSPLTMAGRQGHEDFILSVYPESAVVDRDRLSEIRNWLGVAQLHNAARDGNVSKVKEILRRNSANIDEVDSQGRTPWLLAVEHGHEHVVDVFLGMKRVAFDRTFPKGSSSSGPSVVHVTAESGNAPIMRLLLQSGKFTDRLQQDIFGRTIKVGQWGAWDTPLDIAREAKNMEIVKLLEEHESSLPKRDQTPLESSSSRPSVSTAEGSTSLSTNGTNTEAKIENSNSPVSIVSSLDSLLDTQMDSDELLEVIEISSDEE
ncbi:Nn.00g032120.m01.CDS01 [Neocucurbitaria sp. VM-36]